MSSGSVDHRKKRPKALEFYQKLGCVASHEGLKLHLT